MKIVKTLILTSIITALAASTVFAAAKTDAYKNLENIITEIEPVKEGINYYTASDKNGNDWHGIFDNEGNIIAVAATVYDRGEAEDIAGELGEKIYYKIPMEYRKGADFYQVIIPTYKGTDIDVLCARPLNLYDDGYKVINDWDMDKEGEILILRTNLTPSYMIRFTNDDNEGFLRWDEEWYPEEANEKWSDNMVIPLP